MLYIYTLYHIQWLEDFIGYLGNWKKSVVERDGCSKLQKNQMMLSPETILGLKITGIINVYIIIT